MEVKIGVQNAAREIVVESSDSADKVASTVTDAINKEQRTLTLTDEKGRQVIVPTDKLAYVEIGEPQERRVGFGAL